MASSYPLNLADDLSFLSVAPRGKEPVNAAPINLSGIIDERLGITMLGVADDRSLVVVLRIQFQQVDAYVPS